MKGVYYVLVLCFLSFSAIAADGLNSSAGSDLPLGASNTEYMRITKDGNVGIGTDSPKAMLEVRGGIKVGATQQCDSELGGLIRWTGTNMQYCDGSRWTKFKAGLQVQWVSSSSRLSYTLNASGNGFSSMHVVKCPEGTVVLSGSCFIGGWRVTKVVDAPNGNGWSCIYGTYNGPAGYAELVYSTALAACMAAQ